MNEVCVSRENWTGSTVAVPRSVTEETRRKQDAAFLDKRLRWQEGVAQCRRSRVVIVNGQ